MSLLPSEKAQYSAIIDVILANSDLNTISARRIREELEAKLGQDVSEKKNAVKELIMERFDRAHNNPSSLPLSTTSSTPQTNGYPSTHNNSHTKPKKEPRAESKVKSETPASSTPGGDYGDDSDAVSPPKKKRKQAESSEELDDAKLAAMLQAQENSLARPTRGGSTKKKAPIKKKTPKKKSVDKVRAEDDSDLELNSDGEVKEKKERKGGFHKQYYLSAPLAELVGETTLSRPQVVKKIWEYIKERNLQVPEDKRQIRCDERMHAVFKQDKVHMFTMNKILGKQLYEVEE
ncbi:hypothetical protein OIDMADRAFT_143370 [Oidiodendron maius Zn]|uniref:Uncharacterized protein n=1 Tax=Oidiodendron maius (strain Zn) TaxID=913774 RepID=A0A0C3HLI2_OIDMZ|nr:hypothetical protein OIDMADRAFT_143370 [Oidiodendron maius Zn]